MFTTSHLHIEILEPVPDERSVSFRRVVSPVMVKKQLHWRRVELLSQASMSGSVRFGSSLMVAMVSSVMYRAAGRPIRRSVAPLAARGVMLAALVGSPSGEKVKPPPQDTVSATDAALVIA